MPRFMLSVVLAALGVGVLVLVAHGGGRPPTAVADVGNGAPWRPDPPAVTKYVDPAGSGSTCDQAAPCSLATALTAAAPGDVFGLAPGTYDSTATRSVTHSGTPSAHIVFRALDPAQQPRIRYTGTTTTPARDLPYVFQVANGVSYVDFWDLSLDGGAGGGPPTTWAGAGIRLGVGGSANNIHHVGVYGSRIWDMSSAGIATGVADYLTAVGNQVWHVGYNDRWARSSAISLWTSYWSDSDPGIHSVIVGNVLSGAYDAQTHTDGNGVIVDLQADSTLGAPPALVANNVMFGNGGRGFIATRSQNAWVVNNTAYRNQLDPAFTEAEGFAVSNSGSGNQHWFNNIASTINAAGHEGYYIPADAQPTHVMSNNLHYGSPVPIYPGTWDTPDRLKVADPQFTNPPAIAGTAAAADTQAPWTLGDGLTLQATSPAIDAGIDPQGSAPAAIAEDLAAWLGRDLLGNPRAGAFDLGAYEYQPPAPTPTETPTPTPT